MWHGFQQAYWEWRQVPKQLWAKVFSFSLVNWKFQHVFHYTCLRSIQSEASKDQVFLLCRNCHVPKSARVDCLFALEKAPVQCPLSGVNNVMGLALIVFYFSIQFGSSALIPKRYKIHKNLISWTYIISILLEVIGLISLHYKQNVRINFVGSSLYET